ARTDRSQTSRRISRSFETARRISIFSPRESNINRDQLYVLRRIEFAASFGHLSPHSLGQLREGGHLLGQESPCPAAAQHHAVLPSRRPGGQGGVFHPQSLGALARPPVRPAKPDESPRADKDPDRRDLPREDHGGQSADHQATSQKQVSSAAGR